MIIDDRVEAFVRDVNAELAKIRKDARPAVRFRVNGAPITRKRTPRDQARCVSRGVSWVCWSSHMTNKARHVQVLVNGRVYGGAKKHRPVKTGLGGDFGAFKAAWNKAMERHQLRNAQGRKGWYLKDAFHLELPNSKLRPTDRLAQQALDEYARQTRRRGWRKNARFERRYEALLKPHIEKYETGARR